MTTGTTSMTASYGPFSTLPDHLRIADIRTTRTCPVVWPGDELPRTAGMITLRRHTVTDLGKVRPIPRLPTRHMYLVPPARLPARGKVLRQGLAKI